MQTLDLTSFEKAIKSLEEALNEVTIDNRSFIKDSVIQRFEYTYELCIKMLKRYLEVSEHSSENIDGMTFQTLIRSANEKGLLKGDLTKWLDYRGRRNITSHTYDGDKADAIISIVPDFYDEAVYFLSELKKKAKDLC
ncbi:hypothetical protein FACS189449_01750 [Alphaproteobacteria bacterium]|nr:hypothetical protein FACS189449_01750 [Alphaproteobacteria bacterium]